MGAAPGGRHDGAAGHGDRLRRRRRPGHHARRRRRPGRAARVHGPAGPDPAGGTRARLARRRALRWSRSRSGRGWWSGRTRSSATAPGPLITGGPLVQTPAADRAAARRGRPGGRLPRPLGRACRAAVRRGQSGSSRSSGHVQEVGQLLDDDVVHQVAAFDRVRAAQLDRAPVQRPGAPAGRGPRRSTRASGSSPPVAARSSASAGGTSSTPSSTPASAVTSAASSATASSTSSIASRTRSSNVSALVRLSGTSRGASDPRMPRPCRSRRRGWRGPRRLAAAAAVLPVLTAQPSHGRERTRAPSGRHVGRHAGRLNPGQRAAAPIASRREPDPALLADRMRQGRGRDADLRLRRVDRRARAPGHLRRAALLRPVPGAQRAADRTPRLGGGPARPRPGRAGPAYRRPGGARGRGPRVGPPARPGRGPPPCSATPVPGSPSRAAAATCGSCARSRTDRRTLSGSASSDDAVGVRFARNRPMLKPEPGSCR